jgi:hypothetical protein
MRWNGRLSFAALIVMISAPLAAAIIIATA